MALKSEQEEIVSNTELERAFTELASFLYQKYRSEKQEQQIQESTESARVNDIC